MIERKRVAMVITGHFRTYEQNFPFLKQNFLDHHDVDIYISTWDNNYIGHRNNAPKSKIMSDEELQRRISIYPNVKKVHIGNSEEIKKLTNDQINLAFEEKRMGYWDLKDKKYRIHPGYKTSRYELIKIPSAWYCVQEGFKLIDNPNEYDFLIKSRFDVLYLKPFKFQDYDLVATPPSPHKRVAYKFRNYIIYGKPVIKDLMVTMYEKSMDILFKYRNFSAERMLEFIFDTHMPNYYVDPELIGKRDYTITGM